MHSAPTTVVRARAIGGVVASVAAALALGASAAEPPVFQTDIEIITVDAVVVDAKGHLIPGLTQDDFAVQEDGRDREIVTFEALAAPAPPGPSAAAPDSAPPPSHIVTNVAPPPTTGSTFLLVVDDIHLGRIGSVQARNTLERFLREAVVDGDRVVIVTTGTAATWSGTVPSDRNDLLAFVARLQGRSRIGSPMTEVDAMRIAEHGDKHTLDAIVGLYYRTGACGSPPFDCASMVRSDARAVHGGAQGQREASLARLKHALGGLAGRRGRKGVVFLTEGFVRDDVSEHYRGAVRTAQEVNAAIYFVDVRGLQGLSPEASAEAPREAEITLPAGAQRDPQTARAIAANLAAQRARMLRSANERFSPRLSVGVETMAEETGGFVVRSGKDLAGGLARVSSESRGGYLIGFRPGAEGRDGLRKIKIRVAGKGLTVRARQGYFARGARRETAPAENAATDLLVPSFETPSDVPLRLAAYVLEPASDQTSRVVVVTDVETSALTFAERDGGRVATLALRVEAIPRDGGDVRTHNLDLELQAPADGGAPAPHGRWSPVRSSFALPAGVYRVRVSVRDNASGKGGAVSQRVVVADPAAFGVSTPIVSDILAPAAAAGAVRQPAPVAHRRFSAARPVLCAFEVWGATKDPATGAPAVDVQLVVNDAQHRPVATLPSAAIRPSASDRLQQVLEVPVQKLSPGEYEMVLTIEDRVSGRREERRQTVDVEAAPPAPPPLASASRDAAPVREGKPPPPVAADLAPILERAGRYVVEYGEAFSRVLAQETYRQEYVDGEQQVARRGSLADLVFVTLPGPIPWATFRDVYEVDGHKVRDREARLERLLRELNGAVHPGMKAILEESARFNIGPVQRDVNIPTLALLFLHPENQRRFAFERKGRSKIQNIDTVEITLVEYARPCLVRTSAGDDVPVKGKVWIDPERGTVMRTDVEYDLDTRDPRHGSRGRVVTEYRTVPGLGMFVPTKMLETYDLPRTSLRGLQIFGDGRDEVATVTVKATAQYSGYRRFEVATEETFRPAVDTR